MWWIMHLQVMTAVCGLMLWFIGASTKKKENTENKGSGVFSSWTNWICACFIGILQASPSQGRGFVKSDGPWWPKGVRAGI